MFVRMCGCILRLKAISTISLTSDSFESAEAGDWSWEQETARFVRQQIVQHV